MAELTGQVTFNDEGGNNDPGNGKGVKPSSKTAKKGTNAPKPHSKLNTSIPLIGSPVMGTPMVTEQLHLGDWKIYSKDGKLLASDGTHELQFVMVNPGGITQTSAPNKMSDGSDGSSGASSGNTASSGRTITNASPGSSPTSGDVGQILSTIKQRESSGNYRAEASTSTASGAYQFTDGTWRSVSAAAGYSGYSHAADAPPAVQDAVAGWYVKDILNRSNGDINAVPNEWYTGNIYGNMTQKQLAANNGLTSAQYRANWFRSYNNLTGGSPTSALAYADTGTSNYSGSSNTPSSSGGSGSTGGGGGGGGGSGSTNIVDAATSKLSGLTDSLNCVPCVPNEITAQLSKLTPGGLAAMVLDLTDLTKDLTKVTKKIADLLPGVPFNITSEIIKQFTEGFSDISDGLNMLNKELTGGMNQILGELGCITKDLNAINDGVNNLINSYSVDQLFNALPANLSIDDLISGNAANGLLNINLPNISGGSGGTSPSEVLTSLTTAANNAADTVTSTLSGTGETTPTTPTTTTATASITEELTITTLPDVEMISLSIPLVDPNHLTDFQATTWDLMPTITKLMGRDISEEEYNVLIAAIWSIVPTDKDEQAWFAKTMINRSKKTGLDLVETVRNYEHIDKNSNMFICGPGLNDEMLIADSLKNNTSSVQDNNYYFDPFRPDSQTVRDRVSGILIGRSLVFPGAKWP